MNTYRRKSLRESLAIKWARFTIFLPLDEALLAEGMAARQGEWCSEQVCADVARERVLG